MNRTQLAQFWDEATRAFLAGRDLDGDLRRWAAAYTGRGDCAPDMSALAEPFLGDISLNPRAVFLTLNPGRAAPDFQYATGRFASNIARRGSYAAWAATWPYATPAWTDVMGGNGHARAMLQFARRWHEDASLRLADVVLFELYPWHSTRFDSNRCDVDPELLREYVFEPIESFDPAVPVFAFGAPWMKLLEANADRWGMTVVDRLGSPQRPWPGRSPTRRALALRTAAGRLVLTVRQQGTARPPGDSETAVLRKLARQWNLRILLRGLEDGTARTVGRVSLIEGRAIPDQQAAAILNDLNVLRPGGTATALSCDDGIAFALALPFALAGTHLWAEVEGRDLAGTDYETLLLDYGV